MRRYIVLLLITGILWAQTDFDTLILKNGTTYFGEYSKIEGEIVYFKPQNALAFQPISIKQIQTLKLKDGHFIIGDILTYEEYQKKLIIIEDGKNSLIFDTLILKSGIAYFGEYSKIEEEIVYFKPQNAFAFQPISIKQIQTLKLKDGHFIIGDGKNILTFEEYQKEKIKGNIGLFLFWSIIAVVCIGLIVNKSFGGWSSGGGSDEWGIGDNLGPY